MALTFPLPLEEFFDGLPIKSVTFDLGEALEMSETGGGEILTADVGTRLWNARVQLRTGRYAEIEQAKAKLNSLRYAGRSLLVHSFPLIGPQKDPRGVTLGASVPFINSVAANNREISIGGLPIAYTLTPGDFISFTYGTNPFRFALHQISVGGFANGGGFVDVELSSFVRTGWAQNAAVRLIKPIFKAVVVPGSTNSGTSGGQWTDGVAFDLIQTLR